MALTLWAVLGASLLGSVHCAAMCGPLATVAQAGEGARSGRWLYHLGRLAVYLAAGVLAGGMGAALDRAVLGIVGPVAARLAGGLLVLLGGLGLLRQAGVRLPSLAAPFARLTRGVLLRLGSVRPGWRGLALGAASALLPCGWLYAYVAVAAGTGSPGGGTLTMAAFWLGTVPAVVAAAFVVQRVTGPFRRRLPAFGAFALIVIGLLIALGRNAHGGHAPAGESSVARAVGHP